jgi:branched-chain amino acid transport system permease protein
LMAVLGGSRHWAGPAVGAVAITALLFGFTSADNAIAGKVVLGLVLILVILFMPHGVLGRWTKRKAPLRPAVIATAKPRSSFAVNIASTDTASDLLLSTRGLAKSFVVSGHYLATAGQVKFDERKVTGIAAHRVARSGIARTYQIPRPFSNLTVLENVALTSMFGAEGLGRHAAEAQAWQWLAFTGLSERAGALPDELNLHQRKFLEFARALAARPQLLMLDEVLSGLTPSEIDGAVALIERIRAEGTTIVFVEHVMRAVAALCDRIVVFDRGAVLASGAFADVMAQPDVVVAYLGKGIDAGGATRDDKPDTPRGALHAA